MSSHFLCYHIHTPIFSLEKLLGNQIVIHTIPKMLTQIKLSKQNNSILEIRLSRENEGSTYCILLPLSTKECNYRIRADQINSSLAKFIAKSISAYISK